MDAANILVVVLTSAAVGWLIWVEIHSRRNRTDEPAREALESAAANETAVLLKADGLRRETKPGGAPRK